MTTLPRFRSPDGMRKINDLIWDSLSSGGWDEPIAFFCECPDAACYQPVWLSAAEYEQARSEPGWTAVAGAHAGIPVGGR